MSAEEMVGVYDNVARLGQRIDRARLFSSQLMIEHLRTHHRMKLVDIANELGIPLKFVKRINWQMLKKKGKRG